LLTRNPNKKQHSAYPLYVLDPWRDKWAPEKAFINADAFIETLYNSLVGYKGEFISTTEVSDCF
jgi:hypothetical protein